MQGGVGGDQGERTLSEIAGQFQVHPHQVTAWKKQALAVLPEVFSRKRDTDEAHRTQREEELYGQIGRLKVELDWLKKNLAWDSTRKRAAIDADHPTISLSRQCELLGLSRSIPLLAVLARRSVQVAQSLLVPGRR